MKKMKRKFILISALLIAALYYGCEKNECSKPSQTNTHTSTSTITADFNFVITNQATRTVTFTNTSAGAQNYSWHLGDGEISSVVSPEHSYTGYGDYQVMLTAFGQSGSAVVTKILKLHP